MKETNHDLNQQWGGPAFPFTFADKSQPGITTLQVFLGMTLRDYFAGQALPDCIRMAAMLHSGANHLPWTGAAAKAAYDIADAMLVQRALVHTTDVADARPPTPNNPSGGDRVE
jgi:hypothetical protein